MTDLSSLPLAATPLGAEAARLRRNAIAIALVTLVAMAAMTTMIVVAGPIDTTQDTLILVVTGAIATVARMSAVLSWQGLATNAMRLLIGVFLVGMIATPLLVAGLGWPIALGAFAIAFAMTTLTLPAREVARGLWLAGAAAIAIVAVDALTPFERISSPYITSVGLNVVLVVVLGIFGPLAAFSIRDLRLIWKLGLLLVLYVVGFVVFGAYSFNLLNEVRIGGPLYNRINQGQALIADILPPPVYIVEPLLNVLAIQEAAGHEESAAEVAAELDVLFDEALRLRADYEDRIRFWERTLPAGEARRILLEEARPAADRFFAAFDTELVPAARAGDLEAIETILHDELEPAFAAHKAAITTVVGLARVENDAATRAAQQAVDSAQPTVLLIGLMIFGLGLLVSVLIARTIIGPLNRLSQASAALMEGRLVEVEGTDARDELGSLAQAFNNMARQVRESIGALEARVFARTRNLEVASEVGGLIAQRADAGRLLFEAVNTITERLGVEYAQIYLYQPATRSLVLRAGSGAVGEELVNRGLRQAVGAGSLNGRAAAERRPVVINDTQTEPGFKYNPLLPFTRSEACVPLLMGERLVGVLDVQSREPGKFSADMVPALELLAKQLAVALRNAELLAAADRARQELETQTRQMAHLGWQEFLDGVQRAEHLERQYQGQADFATLVDAARTPLQAPILVKGAPVGELEVELAGARAHTEEEAELVKAVAVQVGQQIDNLRLLAQSEAYRAEAERALQRQTRAGWQAYVESADEALTTGFVYEAGEVKPAAAATPLVAGTARPLTRGGVAVGEIAVEMADLSAEEAQILGAVVEQLTARVENLRLATQTESALGETEQLYAISAELNAAGSLEDIARVARLAAPEEASTFLFTHLTDALGQPDRLRVAVALDEKGEVLSAFTGMEFQVTMFSFAKHWIANPDQPFLVEAVATDPRIDDATRMLLSGAGSMAILPLMVSGRWVGQISYSWLTPREFSSNEHRLFSALMRQVSTTMDNYLLFEQTRKRAEREALVNQITQKIQQTTTVPAALEAALRQISRALKTERAVIAVEGQPAPNGHGQN